MYEFFEHTADLGIRISAPAAADLFRDAAHALTALLIENPAAIRPIQTRSFTLETPDRADLLHDWLEEILFQFSARRMIFVQFEVGLEENKIIATARGEPLDLARHRPNLDVKAITYHQLSVEQSEGNWEARVIVDI